MKSFLEWLRHIRLPSIQYRREQMRIDMFWSFADRNQGTDNRDLAGLFMTAAERARMRMQDET